MWAPPFETLLLSLPQMQILDKFPIEGGQKDPKKRIIPFLPGNPHAHPPQDLVVTYRVTAGTAGFRIKAVTLPGEARKTVVPVSRQIRSPGASEPITSLR